MKNYKIYFLSFLVFIIAGGFFCNFFYLQFSEAAKVEISAIVGEVLPPLPPPVGVPWPSPETKVVLEGRAYPLSPITILMDGRVIGITEADSLANFRKEIIDITPGVRTFGLWAEDKKGRRSLTFSFTTKVRFGMITTIKGIFLPPTIELSETFVQKGDVLNILGQTVPESEVNIFIRSPEEIIRKTKADLDGIWLYAFDTIILEDGFHTVRAKAICPKGLLSTYSHILVFNVEEEVPIIICPRADLNKDGFTNLIDFSIMLYWWGRHCPCADQNRDGVVNLIDFSIMLFYWTG